MFTTKGNLNARVASHSYRQSEINQNKKNAAIVGNFGKRTETATPIGKRTKNVKNVTLVC